MCDSLSSTKVLLVIFKNNLKQGKHTKHTSYFHNNKYDWLTLKKRVKRLILFSFIPNNRILPSDFKLLTEHTWISRNFSETNILQIIPKIPIKLMVTIWCQHSYVKTMWTEEKRPKRRYNKTWICRISCDSFYFEYKIWWGNLHTSKHNFWNVSKHRQVSFRTEEGHCCSNS